MVTLSLSLLPPYFLFGMGSPLYAPPSSFVLLGIVFNTRIVF